MPEAGYRTPLPVAASGEEKLPNFWGTVSTDEQLAYTQKPCPQMRALAPDAGPLDGSALPAGCPRTGARPAGAPRKRGRRWVCPIPSETDETDSSTSCPRGPRCPVENG